MKLGFNLLLWATHVTEAHYPVFDELKRAGYDGVEVPIFEGTREHYARLGQRLKDAGLGSTTVTVMPGGGKNAISADAGERRAGLEHIKWATDCTAALGGEVLCGPFHQPLGEFSGKGATEDETARCVEVHKEAARYAAKANVDLAVEPLNRFECYFLNTNKQAQELVERVAEPNYGYLYDTFHSNIEDKNQPQAIRDTFPAINHVHISNNDRGTPGTGPIDFAGVFKALKAAGYDRWMTVEAFGSALPDLAAATRVWRPLFEKPEDVYLGAVKLMKEGWAAA